ncbi:MAG: heme ABC transporter permease [Bdellovibrionales bacterium]
MLFQLANPNRFFRIADIIQPAAAVMAVIALVYGLWQALFVSPPDYQQGETVRIMYVHVPAAWMALLIYSTMAVAAICGLVWKHTLADLYCRAAAPLGAAMTLLCLITGSLWGKPMWGAWWVWDARLTSVAVLLLLYFGYLALVRAYETPWRGERAGAILLLVGFVNIPVIKFSVDWWATLHQPASVLRMDGPAIDATMMTPLLAMALAYVCGFTVLVLVRLRAEWQLRKNLLQELRLL